MNTFKVRKDSWHYQFINVVGFDKYEIQRRKDFCSYWRLFLRASLLVLLTVALILFFVGGFIFILATETVSVVVSLVVLAVLVALIVGLLLLVEKIQDFSKEAMSGESTSLIATKYKSFKGKVCPLVEYK